MAWSKIGKSIVLNRCPYWGMCDGVVLHVTYTERGERIRVISARRAEKHEQNFYYSENSF
jgi:uncharacterized DUF497 family protein